MMLGYFDKLSPREKLLITIAGALLAVLILVMLIVRPLLNYRADSVAAFQSAAETRLLVARAASSPTNSGRAAGTNLRAILTDSASRSGIVINRINSEGPNIDLSIGNTSTVRLYAWLANLANEHQVFVSDAALQPSSDGTTITARLTVTRG